jgi:hypothetical protein
MARAFENPFRLNLGCLVRVGAIIKNGRYRQNRQKSPNFELLTRLPQVEGHPFYFFFLNHPYKSFSKNILLQYNIAHFCTNIRPTNPSGHGYPTGPTCTKNYHFYFLLFSIKNYINCQNFIKKI